MYERGESLTTEVICNTYKDLVEKHFEGAVHVDDEIKYEWARIPHFYTPFYVYKYATGLISALCIVDKLKKEDFTQLESFVNKVKERSKLDYLTENKSLFTKENISEYLEYAMVLFFNLGKKTNKVEYFNCVKIVQDTINRLKSNANFDMSVDNMLLKIWEEAN